jgi:ABC-type transport system substrate-binding protein
MKKSRFKHIVWLIIVLLMLTAVISCGEEEETTTEPTTTEPTTTEPTKETPTTTTAPTTTKPVAGPEYGGTLRVISDTMPAVLGYPPEFGMTGLFLTPTLEKLLVWDENGNFVPCLAESWEADPEALTITWHLRKAVKFHDGTDWDAEALRWNFQINLDHNTLTDGEYVKSLEVVDDYTLKMYLTEFNWMMFQNYGWMFSVSPTAFKNAGATEEERVEWARLNSVGTGPFIISDFKRDTYLKFVKNENYWREGMPYLDGLELRLITDPMVAAAALEEGEADEWVAVSAVQNIVDLESKGFKINEGPGMFNALLFPSADPSSPFSDKKVREAVEYAIDRPTLAQMLGQGWFEPLYQMSSNTAPSYIEGYNPRPYNPEKARELLEEAGYANGFSIILMGPSYLANAREAMTAIQSNLRDVGIIAEIDVADFGRFLGQVFGTGWEDLVYSPSGINPDSSDLFIHYGPNPMTYKPASMYKSPEYLALCNEALDPKFQSPAEAMPTMKEAIRQAGEDAMIVPLYRSAQVSIYYPYVHTNYLKIHLATWNVFEDWMEEH